MKPIMQSIFRTLMDCMMYLWIAWIVFEGVKDMQELAAPIRPQFFVTTEWLLPKQASPSPYMYWLFWRYSHGIHGSNTKLYEYISGHKRLINLILGLTNHLCLNGSSDKVLNQMV